MLVSLKNFFKRKVKKYGNVKILFEYPILPSVSLTPYETLGFFSIILFKEVLLPLVLFTSIGTISFLTLITKSNSISESSVL